LAAAWKVGLSLLRSGNCINPRWKESTGPWALHDSLVKSKFSEKCDRGTFYEFIYPWINPGQDQTLQTLINQEVRTCTGVDVLQLQKVE
jgi:hypothetical protein